MIGIGLGIALSLVALGVAMMAVWRRYGTPLLHFELVRLARGGQQPLVRGAVAAFSLLGLFVVYLSAVGSLGWRQVLAGGATLPLNQLAFIGEVFLFAFLFVQLLAVILAAPVVMGSGIAAEQEAGTLDGLLTTSLSPAEIVLSKFIARLMYVLGIAAAGVPVLVLASLFGGIDLATLVGGTLIVLLGAASLGARTTREAVERGGLREALSATYTRLAVFSLTGTCCGAVTPLALISPVSALIWLFALRIAQTRPIYLVAFLVAYAVWSLFTTVWDLRRAIRQLTAESPRKRIIPAPDPTDSFPEPTPVYGVEARPRTSPLKTSPVRPPLPDEPDEVFTWKEKYFPGSARDPRENVPDDLRTNGQAVLVGVMGTAGLILFIILFQESMFAGTFSSWGGAAFTPVLRIVAVAAVLLMPLVAGVRAAGAVARERERRTLDALLTLPVGRTLVLQAKHRVAMAALRTPAVLVAGFVGISVAVGGAFPVGAVMVVVLGAASIVAATAGGLFFSVVARTVTRATFSILAVIFAAWIAPVFFAPVAEVIVESLIGPAWGEWINRMVSSLSPPLAVNRLITVWPFYRLPMPGEWDRAALVGGFLATAGFTWVAWFARRAARRRFEQLGK